jgi:CRISPR/Cas system CSM-associated protein Csm3 (group 7 of RAMP superfamily)
MFSTTDLDQYKITLVRHARVDLAEQLWGYQEQDGESGHASHVVIEDSCVTLPPGLDEEIWDGVGIDRQWGTAAEGIKFDRATLPKGTTLDLEMTVELPPQDPKPSLSTTDPVKLRTVVGHLLQALQEGKVGFGAAQTRGLGQVKLQDNLTIHEQDWSSSSGILDVLCGNPKACTVSDLVQSSPSTRPVTPARIRIEIDWEPDGPVMVKAGQDGVAVDMLPMVSGYGAQQVAMVLPGSSLKGTMRHQAERIVRTVLGTDPVDAWNGQKKRQRHLVQVDEPLVCNLFGSAKKPLTNNGSATQEDVGLNGNDKKRSAPIAGHGVLAVETCYAISTAMSPSSWNAIATAKSEEKVGPGQSSPLYQAITNAGLATVPGQPHSAYMQQAFHVAIDRWTGGAAEGFLYSALEPFGGQWDPMVLTLDMHSARLSEPLQKPAVALLLLLLRDLARNHIPIGFAGNRGYGSIKVKGVRITAENVTWLSNATLPQADLTKLDPGQLEELDKAWNIWINENSILQRSP